jgi:NADH dehydrogenase
MAKRACRSSTSTKDDGHHRAQRAVAQIGRLHLSGHVAWLMVVCSPVLLVGFRNRLMVMREWIWAFFTRERSARLITGDSDAPT